MNASSHMHVSAIIRRQLKSEFGIYLPAAVFTYANCRPDFSVKYKKIPHYKPYMYDIIKQELRDLASCDKSKFNSVVLADKLGVICHFICDFFCYAHTEKFEGTLMEHLKYESQLNRYIKKRRMVCSDVDFLIDVDLNTSVEDLLSSLDQRYEDYIGLDASLGFDMVCAVQACVEISARLLYIVASKSQLNRRVNRAPAYQI